MNLDMGTRRSFRNGGGAPKEKKAPKQRKSVTKDPHIFYIPSAGAHQSIYIHKLVSSHVCLSLCAIILVHSDVIDAASTYLLVLRDILRR